MGKTRQRGAPSMELPKGEYDAVWLTDDAQRFVIAQRVQLNGDTTELIVFRAATSASSRGATSRRSPSRHRSASPESVTTANGRLRAPAPATRTY